MMAECGLGISIRKSLTKGKLMKELYQKGTLPEHYNVLVEAIDYGRGVYLPPNSSMIDSIINRELEKILFNNAPVEETCKKLAKKINKILCEK